MIDYEIFVTFSVILHCQRLAPFVRCYFAHTESICPLHLRNCQHHLLTCQAASCQVETLPAV